MAEKDEKDLHANQLPDSELDGAAGGSISLFSAKCYTCSQQSPNYIDKRNAEDWKNVHLQSNPGHNCVVTYILFG